MAGFFLSRSAPDAVVPGQFALHGFADPSMLSFPGWTLSHHPYIQGGPEMLVRRGDDFAAAAGTLVFDGRMGAEALDATLDGLDPLAPDWSRIGGHFALVLRRGGRTFLLTDFFAAFQLFHDAGRRFFSTSFLAAAKALPSVSFDAQGLYEFAFNVVPIGDTTIFAELSTLGPRTLIELTEAGSVVHPLAKPLASPSPEHRIEAAADALSRIVAPHVAQFGDRIFCPLSGGLDSRLLLAALRAHGSRPHVYVYGTADSEDVAIARAIGAAEGFAVEPIDKDQLAHVEPDGFAAQVEANFHAFDALPTYGNIFDGGGNLLGYRARHAGGALAASGGCGEVFRNFFYLPDRPVTAAQIAATFFARFSADDATDRFDARRFLDAIRDKILDGLGMAGHHGPIPRLEVEQVYPRVRCRALFGREISLEARQSPYLMPFLDHGVAAQAMALPIALKNAGRFEAALIHAIDPALARHPSAYGHDFAGAPGLRHRFDEWSTRIRPPWLRRASYALQRRLRPMGDEHGGLLAHDYMSRVIDLDMPHMRRFFHVERITDSSLWRRLACAEYLAQHLGGRIKE
jgi:hypothetical protein